MDGGWFYMDGPNRYGPLTVEALRTALVTMPDPRRVFVWCEGMTEWSEAGQVAALARVLPPSPPPAMAGAAAPQASHASAPHVFTPHAFPQTLGLVDQRQVSDQPVEAILAGAQRYRSLVLLIGAQILLSLMTPFVVGGLSALLPEAAVGLMGILILFGGAILAVVTAVCVYRVAEAIDAGVPALWALLMFVPFLNIIVLLVLSAKAQTWCRRHGVEVGFLGPTEASLARLRGGD